MVAWYQARIELILAKVMEVAKEIRLGDKNAGPIRLGAGRRCGLLADACLSGGRRGKEGGPPPGLVVLSVEARAAG